MDIENKRVFPIVSKEKQNNYLYDDHANALDGRIEPLTLENLKELKHDGYAIPAVNEGTVLAIHPFTPKTLIDIEVAKDEILKQKMFQVGEIMNLLGAKDTTYKAKIETSDERTYDAKGKMTIQAGTLKGKFHKFTSNRTKKGIEIRITSDKQWNAKVNYAQAKELSKKYGLDKDYLISSLISNRNPDGRPITSFHLIIEVSQELNELMDISASLNAMTAGFKLSGSFKSIHTYRDKIMINQDILFE